MALKSDAAVLTHSDVKQTEGEEFMNFWPDWFVQSQKRQGWRKQSIRMRTTQRIRMIVRPQRSRAAL